MKKMLCLILSVIITLSAFSILAFADSTPVISIATDKQTVRRNNIVTATVKVSKNSKICAATIEFFYDKDYFSVDSAEVNGSLGMEVINDGAGKGKIRYAVANDNTITAETTLFTVKLKVKKPNGKLSLDFEEVWVDNNGATENVTASVKAKYNSLPETVLSCNHDFKEIILSEPTCEKDGAKAQECKICGWKTESTPIKAKGHTPGEWETVKEATETGMGKRVKKCTVCGKTVQEQLIPPIQKEPVKGDVDRDGKLSAVDARMILRHVARVETLTLLQMANADVNGDYKISATDARRILRAVAGLE